MSNQSGKRKHEESSTQNQFKRSRGPWKYHTNDKARWPDLLHLRSRKLLENQIDYVLDEVKIANLFKPIPAVTFTQFIPANPGEHETEPEKEMRQFQNQIAARLYNTAVNKRDKDIEKYDLDCQTYLGIIYDQLVHPHPRTTRLGVDKLPRFVHSATRTSNF